MRLAAVAVLALLAGAGAAQAQDSRGYDGPRGYDEPRGYDGPRGYGPRGDGGPPSRVVRFPRIGGYPLDICPRDVGLGGLLGGRCGQPVADRFCRSRGFEGAEAAPTMPAGGPTRFIASGDLCTHGACQTFSYIACE